MCGLVGAVSTFLAGGELTTYRALSNFNYLRGIHSAGMTLCYSNKQKGGDYVVKNIHALSHPANLAKAHPEFFDHKDMVKDTIRPRFILGHSRAATIGEVNIENAHPFSHGNVYGMHNGTLDTFSMRTEKRWNDFDTDSEWTIWHINKHGIDKTIPKLVGAYALVWFDVGTQKINFIRNAERTLFYSVPKHGRTMYWSSDRDYLELALKKGGVAFKSIESFKTNTLYTYDTMCGSLKFEDAFTEEKELLGKPRTTYITTKPAKVHGRTQTINHGQRNGSGTKKKHGKTYSSNVVDFKSGKNQGLDIGKYSYLLNKEIEFLVDEPVRNKDGMMCYKFHPIEDSVPFGFIYRSDIFEGSDIKNDTFLATIKSVIPRFVNDKLVPTIGIDYRTFQKVEPVQNYFGFNGEALTIEEYERKLQNKCANCGKDEEVGSASFFTRDEWLCHECVSHGYYQNVGA